MFHVRLTVDIMSDCEGDDYNVSKFKVKKICKLWNRFDSFKYIRKFRIMAPRRTQRPFSYAKFIIMKQFWFVLWLTCSVWFCLTFLKAPVICESGREYTKSILIIWGFILKTHRRQNNHCGSNCHCLRWRWIVPLNDTDSIDQAFTLLWWNHWDWDCLKKVSSQFFLIHFFVKCF